MKEIRFKKSDTVKVIAELAKQDCIENDIPTWDEDELQRLCDEWGGDL